MRYPEGAGVHYLILNELEETPGTYDALQIPYSDEEFGSEIMEITEEQISDMKYIHDIHKMLENIVR